MKELPTIPQQSHILPTGYQSAERVTRMAVHDQALVVPATPWQTPMYAEVQHRERAPACGTSACNLLSIKYKLEQLSLEREAAEAERNIQSSPRKQVAVGRRKLLPIKQSTELPRRMTPLRQMSSLSDTESEETEVDEVLPDQSPQTNNCRSPISNGGPIATAPKSSSSSRSAQHSLASSTQTSPRSNMFQRRSAPLKLSTAPACFRSISSTSDNPELRPHLSSRQISAPSLTFSNADPVCRSRFQSWPGRYRPGRASPLPPTSREVVAQNSVEARDQKIQRCNSSDGVKKEGEQCEENISRWSSDSEDDEEASSLHLSWKPPRRPNSLRSRLSDWLCTP